MHKSVQHDSVKVEIEHSMLRFKAHLRFHSREHLKLKDAPVVALVEAMINAQMCAKWFI